MQLRHGRLFFPRARPFCRIQFSALFFYSSSSSSSMSFGSACEAATQLIPCFSSVTISRALGEERNENEKRYSVLVELWCFFLVVPISAPCFSSEPLKPYNFCFCCCYCCYSCCCLSYTGLGSFVIFLQSSITSFFFPSFCAVVFSVTWIKHTRSFCGVAIKTDTA